MASVKFEMIMIMVTMTCLIAAQKMDMKTKCKLSKEQLELKEKAISSCYENVTKKELPEKDFKQVLKDLPEEDRAKISDCVHKTRNDELFKHNGNVDVDKVKAYINNLEADDATKKALRDGIDECVEDGTERKTFEKCKDKLFKKVCKVDHEHQPNAQPHDHNK